MAVFTIVYTEESNIMPRTAAQNKAIKDKRKKRLLEVALKTFAYRGYTDVTIDDITKAARCSHGLFYHYFSSKEDVFEAVVAFFVLGQSTPLLDAKTMNAFHGAEGLAKFFEVVEKLEIGPAQDLYTAKILLDFERISDRKGVRKEAVARFDIRGTFERLVKEGQEKGEVIDGDPKEIATVSFDLLIGIFECLLSGNPILRKTVSKELLLAMTLKHPL